MSKTALSSFHWFCWVNEFVYIGKRGSIPSFINTCWLPQLLNDSHRCVRVYVRVCVQVCVYMHCVCTFRLCMRFCVLFTCRYAFVLCVRLCCVCAYAHWTLLCLLIKHNIYCVYVWRACRQSMRVLLMSRIRRMKTRLPVSRGVVYIVVYGIYFLYIARLCAIIIMSNVNLFEC